MANSGQGRYPHNSAWAYRADAGAVRNSGSFAFLRTQVRNPRNSGNTMWLDYFFGTDFAAGFGILKRWNGTTWVANPNLKVYWF